MCKIPRGHIHIKWDLKKNNNNMFPFCFELKLKTQEKKKTAAFNKYLHTGLVHF